jgi:hypothetical protein
MVHFYTKNSKMKLGSGKELQPSRVLYIGPSKRLNENDKARVVGSDVAPMA